MCVIKLLCIIIIINDDLKYATHVNYFQAKQILIITIIRSDNLW